MIKKDGTGTSTCTVSFVDATTGVYGGGGELLEGVQAHLEYKLMLKECSESAC